MARWIAIEAGCEMCQGNRLDVDVDRVASAVAHEDGKVWIALTPAERQHYTDLAEAAISLIGAIS